MCGITGFLDTRQSKGHEELAATVCRMATSLRHRGPEDEGTWVDPASGIAFGHRRLSIIDLRPSEKNSRLLGKPSVDIRTLR
jgi:asparagine synthase (glutamine-hydrolysing)